MPQTVSTESQATDEAGKMSIDVQKRDQFVARGVSFGCRTKRVVSRIVGIDRSVNTEAQRMYEN